MLSQALNCLVAAALTLSGSVPATGFVLRGRSENLAKQANASTNASGLGSSQGDRQKRLHNCLSGKRIVFIGPSTSKFDYISLAYFAEYGRWPVEDDVATAYGTGPNPLYEWNVRDRVKKGGYLPPEVLAPVHQAHCNPADGTETFMRYVNYILNGHEVCDGHYNGTWTTPTDIYNSTENRVYVNGATVISYFQWFGDVVQPRGTFDISPVLKVPPQVVHPVCPVGQFPGTWAWSFGLADFLTKVIRYSQPTHLVISGAYWPLHPENAQLWDTVAHAGKLAVSDTGGHVLWRTTPQRKDTAQFDPSSGIDVSRFWNNGWQVFPAKDIVSNLQGATSSDEVFYDATHLKPQYATKLVESFVESYLCAA